MMCLKEYGHKKIQKEIIKLGETNKLTVKKILDLFGRENVRDARDELWKLFKMKLIKWDEKTLDEEGNIYENSRLIWIHKEGDKLPLDPGEIIHDHIADFMYEQAGQVLECCRKSICQQCNKKAEHLYNVSLNCYEDDEEPDLWCSASYDMVALCEDCRNELKNWLNIPVQDPI